MRQLQGTGCENMNHRRGNAPVGHCPECGGVVNAVLAANHCDGSRHAVARRQGRTFCVDCGTRLITGAR
jgi:primosomal protein N'